MKLLYANTHRKVRSPPSGSVDCGDSIRKLSISGSQKDGGTKDFLIKGIDRRAYWVARP